MNLNEMSLKDLKAHQKEVAKAIATFEARAKKAALAELEKKASEMGYALSDLLGAGKAKKPAPAKYRNPADPSQTWTGRGRTPQWMKDFESAGNARDAALI